MQNRSIDYYNELEDSIVSNNESYFRQLIYLRRLTYERLLNTHNNPNTLAIWQCICNAKNIEIIKMCFNLISNIKLLENIMSFENETTSLNAQLTTLKQVIRNKLLLKITMIDNIVLTPSLTNDLLTAPQQITPPQPLAEPKPAAIAVDIAHHILITYERALTGSRCLLTDVKVLINKYQHNTKTLIEVLNNFSEQRVVDLFNNICANYSTANGSSIIWTNYFPYIYDLKRLQAAYKSLINNNASERLLDQLRAQIVLLGGNDPLIMEKFAIEDDQEQPVQPINSYKQGKHTTKVKNLLKKSLDNDDLSQFRTLLCNDIGRLDKIINHDSIALYYLNYALTTTHIFPEYVSRVTNKQLLIIILQNTPSLPPTKLAIIQKRLAAILATEANHQAPTMQPISVQSLVNTHKRLAETTEDYPANYQVKRQVPYQTKTRKLNFTIGNQSLFNHHSSNQHSSINNNNADYENDPTTGYVNEHYENITIHATATNVSTEEPALCTMNNIANENDDTLTAEQFSQMEAALAELQALEQADKPDTATTTFNSI